MAQPPIYQRQADFTSYQTNNPGQPMSGSDLDNEHNAEKVTLDAILINMAILQRDDTAMANAVVHPDALNTATLSLIASDWTPKGPWVTATDYVAGDMVEESLTSYVAVSPHTSGTFATDHAAGKWVVLGFGAGVQSTSIFTTIADMKLAEPTVGVSCRTLSFYAPNLSLANPYSGGGKYVAVAPQAFDGYGDHEAANGNVWVLQSVDHLNVMQFGAVGDGVTEDYPPIQATLTSADLGRYDVYLPTSDYLISTGLFMREGIKFFGDGIGVAAAEASQPSGGRSTLIAGGAINMLTIQATTVGDFVWYPRVEGIYFGGENVASRAVLARSTRHGYFDIGTERCTFAGLVLDDGNDALSANNHIEQIFYQAGSNAACIDSVGLVIQDSGLGHGTTRTTATVVDCIGGANGSGMHIRDHDSGYFAMVNGSVLFDGAGGTQPRASRKNCIGQLNGNLTAEAGSRNTVLHVNSEPSSITLNGDAVVDYTVIDRNNGARWETFRYKMSDTLGIPASGFSVVAGAPVGVLVGVINAQAIQFATGVDEEIVFSMPVPSTWSQGDVISVKINSYPVGGTTGEDVKLIAGVTVKPIAGGLGGGTVSETSVIDMTAIAAVNQDTITFTVPVEVTDDDVFLSVHLERNGADAADTYTGTFNVLGIEVDFEADGPHTDPGDNWDIPPDVQ